MVLMVIVIIVVIVALVIIISIVMVMMLVISAVMTLAMIMSRSCSRFNDVYIAVCSANFSLLYTQRNELDHIYDTGIAEMFDIAETRRNLQARRSELLAECTANSKLQQRFDQIASQLHTSPSSAIPTSTIPSSSSSSSSLSSSNNGHSSVDEDVYMGGGDSMKSDDFNNYFHEDKRDGFAM